MKYIDPDLRQKQAKLRMTIEEILLRTYASTGPSNSSSRRVSNPTTTSSSTTNVGVVWLPYLPIRSRSACWSRVTSRSSKCTPREDSQALAVWQGGQVGWVNTWTRFGIASSTRNYPSSVQDITRKVASTARSSQSPRCWQWFRPSPSTAPSRCTAPLPRRARGLRRSSFQQNR